MMNHHTRSLLQGFVAVCIAATAGVGHAQENAIESISANQQGSNVIVKIAMKNPVQKPPIVPGPCASRASIPRPAIGETRR